DESESGASPTTSPDAPGTFERTAPTVENAPGCTRQLNDYFDFLASNDIRLKGHRIGIESILYPYVHDGQSAEVIQARFPTLSLEQIYATILYYHHNRGAVDAYLTEWIEFGRRARAAQDQTPSPVRLRLQKLLAEREANALSNTDPRAS